MKKKPPGPAKASAEGKYEAADPAHILPLFQNCNTVARLGYLCRLVERQAQDAEHFDEMCLASERYRIDPTPTNAVKAHLAARRYEAGHE